VALPAAVTVPVIVPPSCISASIPDTGPVPTATVSAATKVT
jgi:hypothetical protein